MSCHRLFCAHAPIPANSPTPIKPTSTIPSGRVMTSKPARMPKPERDAPPQNKLHEQQCQKNKQKNFHSTRRRPNHVPPANDKRAARSNPRVLCPHIKCRAIRLAADADAREQNHPEQESPHVSKINPQSIAKPPEHAHSGEVEPELGCPAKKENSTRVPIFLRIHLMNPCIVERKPKFPVLEGRDPGHRGRRRTPASPK